LPPSKRCRADGNASTAALTAKLADLEQRLATLPDSGTDPALQQKLDDALARLTEAESAAAARASEAEAATRTAARAQALDALSGAVETGQPFTTELQALNDPALTEALSPFAETGSPDPGPAANRLSRRRPHGLRAARDLSTKDGWGDRLVDFLAGQTGARPLTPQEGDTPDAILSRAEFALSEGRVADALAELDPLDPAVKPRLTPGSPRPKPILPRRRPASRTGGMMLWSLTKVILFVVVIAALALGAGLLSETGEALRLTVAGVGIHHRPGAGRCPGRDPVLAVWLALKVLGLLGATFRFLNGDETAISRYFDRNRERKGYRRCPKG
jgi:hypothetical protein